MARKACSPLSYRTSEVARQTSFGMWPPIGRISFRNISRVKQQRGGYTDGKAFMTAALIGHAKGCASTYGQTPETLRERNRPMSDHRYLLPPDPAPRQVSQGDGSNRPMRAGPKISTPISATPSRSSTTATELAELREQIALLRATLHGLATSLRQSADSIGADLDQVELQARLAADDRRRFS